MSARQSPCSELRVSFSVCRMVINNQPGLKRIRQCAHPGCKAAQQCKEYRKHSVQDDKILRRLKKRGFTHTHTHTRVEYKLVHNILDTLPAFICFTTTVSTLNVILKIMEQKQKEQLKGDSAQQMSGTLYHNGK